MVHPPWNDGGNREIPSSFSPLFGNSIDMMLLYSSHLRRDGASPFLKRHCCFFFFAAGEKSGLIRDFTYGLSVIDGDSVHGTVVLPVHGGLFLLGERQQFIKEDSKWRSL